MGKLLDWDNMPAAGTEVVFKGYRNGRHKHWGYVVGETYLIGTDPEGDTGPMIGGGVPIENYGNDFIFELPGFTKYDMKDGMRVVYEDGTVGWLCGDRIQFNDGSCNYLNRYAEDLKDKFAEHYNIVKVIDRDGAVLFEREEQKELTLQQIADKFGVDVKSIRIKE